MDTANNILGKFKPSNGTLFGVIFFLAQMAVFTGTLWVSNGYVSKSTFEAYQADQLLRREKATEALASIAEKLGIITEQMKQNEKRDQKLDNLDGRVRDLEQHKR